MNRDELITKLAMELAEWPKDRREGQAILPLERPCRWGSHPKTAIAWSSSGTCVSRHDWLAERERLIAKPSWDQAPEWAQWLAQDKSEGDWWWYEDKPAEHPDAEWTNARDTMVLRANSGAIPAGHDWRTTLEPRPIEVTAEEDEAFEALTAKARADKLLQADMEKLGGRKFDSDKPMMDLLPPNVELAVARVLTFGAKKYAPDNWRKVPDLQRRYLAAGRRHLNALQRGETYDEETGEHHLAHAICCFSFMLEAELEANHG